MALMLDHVDSPYIRCIGFLYLRYAADPSTIWSWYEPYIHDVESVQIRQGGADSTVGEFARALLGDLDYHGTRLPRFPLVVERQIKVKLLMAEKVEERAKCHMRNAAAMEYFQKIGARVRALYGDDENPITWYDAQVDRVILRDPKDGELLDRPRFQVTFPEYGNTETVTLGEIDLPGGGGDARRGGEGKADGMSSSCQIDGGRNDNAGFSRVGRTVSATSGVRGYPEDGGRDIGGFDDRCRDGRYDSGIERGGYRDRSRSRDRYESLNDARREERELLEEVLRREKDKTAARGRAFAARPPSFKNSLGCPGGMQGKHGAMDNDDRKRRALRGNSKGDAQPKVDGPVLDDGKAAAVPIVPKKTAAELASIEEKKRMLMARYG